MWFENLVLFGILVGITVIGCRAQHVRVNVTFDPPSPVEEGIVTFRCEFTLPSGTVLAQQYWQIVNGARFFEYIPGSGPTIHGNYTEKIFGYITDNATYLEIYFNVTACDVEQYLCNFFADSSAKDSDQQSLEVENMIAPVLKYGDEIISENITISNSSNVTVSCSLEDAGPPLPELLGLEINYVEPDPVTDQQHQIDETCTWIYPDPLEFFVDVNDLPDMATFRCRVDYTGRGSQYSPVLTLNPIQTTTTTVEPITTSTFTTTTTSSPGTVYAFSVGLSTDEQVDSNPIVFDTVITDTHDMYNVISGIFEVPMEGYYYLTTSCLSTDSTNFRVYIRRNDDQILCKSHAGDSDSIAGTCSVVVELFPGDLIRVTADDEFPGVARGDGFSGFTGHRL